MKAAQTFCYLVKLTKQWVLLMEIQNFVQTKQTSLQLWPES